MSLSPDEHSACSLYCGEGEVASWDTDTWNPDPRTSTGLPTNDDDDEDNEHFIARLINLELDHMPESDYLQRFRDRSVDVTARQDAISWMLKVHAYYCFRPLTAYLAVNYLDRFLSSHTLPHGNGWPLQLLSVACVSLAAKMEETSVPLLLDLQVLEPRFMFEPRTVQRMELLVMTNLKWRMRSVTPFDFVDYFVSKLPSFVPRHAFLSHVSDLIISTTRVTDFLSYSPSTIAAAAVLSAAGKRVDTSGDDRGVASFDDKVDKQMLRNCYQLMEEYLVDTCPMASLKHRRREPAPPSPIGVLDAAACASCDTQRSGADNPDPSQAEPPYKRHKPSPVPSDVQQF
ncbi:PREDICTED: cyclin-D2-1-like [Nelumbo nucifera]|uniref:Cyclin-D2-1-like n=2 Tax=Nelumbo nucifera TaxID=4432 RepID=A0A1U8AY35_NELNU|nr:PREDICTED: cyclin-D2-1-like [Nelumbo nucifera]DAD41536.1 TPA_asm: hypothetical protein HUJ06_015859 [Nelumbo nucifera]